jgi:DnaJ-class molecular chaperone
VTGNATSNSVPERMCPDCEGDGVYRDHYGKLVDCEWCSGTGKLNALPEDEDDG